MQLRRRIARSRVGAWLRRRKDHPRIGPAVLALAGLARAAEAAVARRQAAHRAHDRAQEATLAAFERRHAGDGGGDGEAR